MIPDKYTFSKRFKNLLDKAVELGYSDCYRHYKMPDGGETIECHYDIEMDNLFGDGMMPAAFEGADDPMGGYLELQLTSFIWDLTSYLVNAGKLPLDTKGMAEVLWKCLKKKAHRRQSATGTNRKTGRRA